MALKGLEHKIGIFDVQRKFRLDEFKNLECLQKNFVLDFPPNRIIDLSIDDYVQGKGSQTSFCYRLERQLKPLGNMSGSNSEIFVVYFGKKGMDKEYKYRFTKKLGVVQNESAALKNVTEAIVKLIEAGTNQNEDIINSIPIADLFKYKILGTYFPYEYLNLYSHKHLDFFLGELGINPLGTTILKKQRSLQLFKASNNVMKKWTNLEFNRFLYNTFGRPPSDKDHERLKKTLPPIEKVKTKLIDLDILATSEQGRENGTGIAKLNYEKIAKENTKLGKRGENIVYNFEQQFFKEMGFALKDLDHSSEKDDRLGYDIQSLTKNGKAKYIEVKSTKNSPGPIQFVLTENEKLKSKKLKNYFIYIVFEAHTTHPKIWKIKNPLKYHGDKLKLRAINYRVEIGVS